MISVIIPTFNRLELLKVTLDNLFCQTLPADEIIVVDDHSSDGTYEYLKKELSNKVIVLKTKGKGPGAARNTGIETATGKFIQFFDSDDLMTRNKLEDQARLLQQSQKGMVYGTYIPAIQETNEWLLTDTILQHKPFPNKISLRAQLLRGWNTITQACLFDANLIKEVGAWREDLMTHEDKEYLFRISNHIGSPVHSNASAVIYRQHKQQITDNQTKVLERSNNYLKVLSEMNQNTDWGKIDIRTQLRFKGKYLNAQDYHEKLKGSPTNPPTFTMYTERIINKFERFLTKTNWERMHGPCSAPSVFEKYISML